MRAGRGLCLHSRSNCFLLFLIMWAKKNIYIYIYIITAVGTGVCQRDQWSYVFCLGSLCCWPFALLWWVSLWASNRRRRTPAHHSTTTLNNNHYLMRTWLLRAFNAIFKSRHSYFPVNERRVFGAKIRVWRLMAFWNLMLLLWEQAAASYSKRKTGFWLREQREKHKQFNENLLKL